MSELKINLLKITGIYWYVIPIGKTIQEILNVLSSTDDEIFIKKNMEHIIKDKDGQPDILKACEIVYRYSKPEEISFELYESF